MQNLIQYPTFCDTFVKQTNNTILEINIKYILCIGINILCTIYISVSSIS